MRDWFPSLNARLRPDEQARQVWAEARPYTVRYLAAWTPLIAAYLVVFAIANPGPLGWSLLTALINVTIPVVLGGVVFVLVSVWVLRAHVLVQLAAHIGLSLCFTWLWVTGLSWQLGVVRWARGGDWSIVSFQGAALTWQLFQGLLVYFLILAGIYAISLHVRGSYLLAGLVSKGSPIGLKEPQDTEPSVTGSEQATPKRLFIKSDGVFTPLDFVDIIAVSGADDYCELHLPHGACLIRLTLSDLHSRLDSEVFLRVHRSHIININRVVSVSPRAGGGMNVELQSGVIIPASRSGAATLEPYLVS